MCSTPTRRASVRRLLCRIATFACAVLAAGATSGVTLPNIDRLGDAAPNSAPAGSAGRAPDASTHRHAQLGVPTFVWGQRDGPAAERAQTARVSPLDLPETAARAHLRALGDLYALPSGQADAVPVAFSQPLPNGGALVKFRNRIGGVEVFREEAAVLLGPSRELVAVGGFVSGGTARRPFRSSAAAAAAVALSDWDIEPATLARLIVAGEPGEPGDYSELELPAAPAGSADPQLAVPVRVKPVLFRLPDELRPAWYVEVQMRDATTREVDGYAYVIDDEDGSLLFRHNLRADAAFTYRVFAETGGNNLPLPSPIGRNGYPHPTATPDGFQGAAVASNLIALQNIPFSNNDPWLPAGATVTTGNNVDAFADLVTPDGFNAGDQRAPVSAAGVFDYTHNPALPPAANATQINAAVVNLFYLNNWLHDWFYDAGFNEAAGNGQTNNFSRGGVGNDSIIAEAQDFAGTDNANMLTPADGGRPRMRMYLFNTRRPAVTSIAVPATSYTSFGGTFGPQTFNVTAAVLAAPFGNENGCSPLAGFAGKIALVTSAGPCQFQAKTRNAEAAGAVGVIIYRSVDTLPTSMTGDGGANVGIPATIIGTTDGNAVKTLLAAQTVTATISGGFLPNRDGTLDNTIVAHEWAHYLSNRLVGNGAGLGTQQGSAMGEGWSDFVAMLMLVKATDAALPNNANFNGTYAGGAYVLAGPATPPTQGGYYGVRRYPSSRDMTKNPLTFKHIANGVALPATPAPASGANGANNAEVHNSGEVWSAALWECYGNLLDDTLGATPRLTFAQAQDRMKRYLVLGLKLTPVSPTYLQALDALLAAIVAQDVQDYVKCLQGFTKRGMGIGAVAPDRYSLDHAGVVENFTAGGALAVAAVSLSDAAAACDADGTIDNGENGTLSITLQNVGITTLSATSGSVATSNPHVIFPLGNALTIPTTAPGQVITLTIPVQIANSTMPETAQITVTVDDPALAIARPVVAARSFYINVDQQPGQSASDDVETAATAWTTGSTAANPPPFFLWQRIAVTGTDHRWFGPDADAGQLTWLQSPPLNVAAAGNFAFTFRHRHSFEYDLASSNNYDGGQIQISTNGGANWTSVGGLASPAYNGTLTAYSGNVNQYAGQQAYVRRNGAWPALETVTVNLGTAYAGQTVLVRFVVATDSFGPAAGWEIDDIAFTNITNLPFWKRVATATACYAVSVAAGAQQWTTPGAPFAQPLQALVTTTGGAPLSGVAVTFATPGAGASAAFGGASVVVTNAQGVATSPGLTANGTAGAFDVTATVGPKSAAFPLVNAANAPNLDADGNLQYDALTDGVLLLRQLRGMTGSSLVAGALGPLPGRTAGTIAPYRNDIRPLLDVDGNGQYAPETDGVLIFRYLLGFRGARLIENAIGNGAKRTQAAQIEAWIQSLLPP
jgi:hypothetical protein